MEPEDQPAGQDFWRRAFTALTTAVGIVVGVLLAVIGWFIDRDVKSMGLKVDEIQSELHHHELEGVQRDTECVDDNRRDRARLDKLEQWVRDHERGPDDRFRGSGK